MSEVEINWSDFIPLSELPARLSELDKPGVYLWRVSLPERPDDKFSYYVGSCTTRTVGGRLFEHIRDTLGFRYYIRDHAGNWLPECNEQFWSRITNIRESTMEVLDYLERGRYAWARMESAHTRQAETSIYLRLKSMHAELDNTRQPFGSDGIKHAFYNTGSHEIVSLLGPLLDYRAATGNRTDQT